MKICLGIVLLLIGSITAKGGRGGFSSRGGSRGGGSKSGGYSFSFGGSKPAPAPSFKAPSYNPAPPSYGWNANRGSSGSSMPSNQPSYGWNVGNTNTGAKPASTNYGWNVNNNNAPKPSAPVGPPPAYPGLQNRPIPNNNNKPPAYSPSNVNPPAYNPSYNNPQAYNPGAYNTYNSKPGSSFGTGNSYPRQNTYNTYGSNTGYHPSPNYYGNTFGSQGLPGNTFISNNYYGSRGGSSGSGFLTNALFFGAGMGSGYLWGSHRGYDSYSRRQWNEEEDRKWRATTQAPYFENKVPGEEKVLPASAVVGAATAFGLVSLLPLNVPSNKPLMYCTNGTAIAQAQIMINNENVYQCMNETIQVSCSQLVVNGTESECVKTTMQCETEVAGNIYCTNGTLLSKNNIFCNSTTLLNGTNINETTTILNCYEGQLPEHQTGFVPTTTTTPAPVTEKPLSFGAKVHIFFLKLIGKGDLAEKPTTTLMPEVTTVQGAWVPEALTIPPETTTTISTTTEGPYVWMEQQPVNYENGTSGMELKPVNEAMLNMYKTSNELLSKLGDGHAMTVPPTWTKVYVTDTTTPMPSTAAASETTTSN